VDAPTRRVSELASDVDLRVTEILDVAARLSPPND
jgi:hypothetical protein